MSKLYETFHKNTSAQSSTIKKNNFTYRHILYFVDKYLYGKNKVLDVGCGSGTLCLYIANKKKNILGIDISKKAIQTCIESSKTLNLTEYTSFKAIDFPKQSINGKFDLVILTEVIEHIKDDKLALKSIYKLLNKNGILIISTPSVNALLHKIGYAKQFDKRVGHLRRYSTEGLVKMCKESGFKIIETKKIEGVLRNYLFLSTNAGKFVRFIKWSVSDVVTIIDNLTIPIFGESNILIVCKKP